VWIKIVNGEDFSLPQRPFTIQLVKRFPICTVSRGRFKFGLLIVVAEFCYVVEVRTVRTGGEISNVYWHFKSFTTHNKPWIRHQANYCKYCKYCQVLLGSCIYPIKLYTPLLMSNLGSISKFRFLFDHVTIRHISLGLQFRTVSRIVVEYKTNI
jgi:hypothetical protein